MREMMRDMMSIILEGVLEDELDEEPGYSKYDYRNKETDILKKQCIPVMDIGPMSRKSTN